MRERILIVAGSILYVVFYPLIWLVTKILAKLSKEGPGWGD